jgi:hypothetical protein
MRTLVAAAATFAVIGCGGTPPPPSGSAPADAKAPTAPRESAARVEVLPITYAGLDRAVREQKGKVVLVDVWSTT